MTTSQRTKVNATTGMLTPIDADPTTVGVQNFAAGTGPISVTTTKTVH